MNGIKPKIFVEEIKKIEGIEERYGHILLFKERRIYIMQDSSSPFQEPKTTAYDLWRNHKGYKIASSCWIPLAKSPVTKLAILLNEKDLLEGEYRKDLVSSIDNDEPKKGKYQSWLEITAGRIVSKELKHVRDIKELLRKID